jgi:hypothetical protein
MLEGGGRCFQALSSLSFLFLTLIHDFSKGEEEEQEQTEEGKQRFCFLMSRGLNQLSPSML